MSPLLSGSHTHSHLPHSQPIEVDVTSLKLRDSLFMLTSGWRTCMYPHEAQENRHFNERHVPDDPGC